MQPSSEFINDDAAKILRDAEIHANGAGVHIFEGASNAQRLDELVEFFQTWLFLPNTNALKFVLAAAAANIMEGDPLWILLVGAPGCGKTEILQPLVALPRFYETGTLTEAALLSGAPKREQSAASTGGLLRTIGDHGSLILKDFGTVLSMQTEKRATLLAALREIYDQSWTRSLGADGGRSITWKGKCGLLGACTPIIDLHHAVMAALGERFLLFRMPVANATALAEKSLTNGGTEKQMRRELTAAVGAWYAALDLPKTRPELTDVDRAFLVPLATLVARARSAVNRDPRTREIDLVSDSEAPGRLARQFSQLLAGAKVIGLTGDVLRAFIREIALDCIPALRRRALEVFAESEDDAGIFTTSKVAEILNHPTGTVRRTLEDLTAHGLLKRTPGGKGLSDLFEITEATAIEWDKIR